MGHSQNVRRVFAAALALLLAAAAVAQEEGFDQDGSDWSATIFPVIIASGGGTFERAALSKGQGAPNTLPPLPINQGGDKEGRYFEDSLAASYSVALTPEKSGFPHIDGYIGIGNPDPFGSQSVGFLLFASAESTITSLNAYVAMIRHASGSNTATLSIRRIRDGILGGGPDTLVTSRPFPIDLANENYLLAFTMFRHSGGGHWLIAKLHRATVADGQMALTRIDLLDEPGVQHSLVVDNVEPLLRGRAGVLAFARGGNSIFFDDLRGCFQPCDVICSGECNAFDIEAFLDVLFNNGQSNCLCAGDLDGNRVVDAFDIEPFLQALFGP